MTHAHDHALHVIVEGRVQGVGYRDACVDEARALGLAGWVRSRRDGTVEVLARGRHDAITALHAWLGHGPSWAHVQRVIDTPATLSDDDAPCPFERRPTA